MSRTPPYNVWYAMLQRCENPNAQAYHNYGGRGISVCKRWHSFKNFWADMKSGYRKGLTIDRVDNDGDYQPSNCCWVTRRQQANNCRFNRTVSYNGKTLTLSEWEDETGINQQTIKTRLNYGWSIEKALTLKPVIGRNQYFRV